MMASIPLTAQDIEPKILSSSSHQIPGKIKVTEYTFSVPLDYNNSRSTSLKVFARGAELFENPTGSNGDPPKNLPWILYLQGGPGGACAPVRTGGYTSFFLNKGYRILFMDQRGTGLSTAITTETLGWQGDAQKQADYLKHFRADNIVRDAEAIRKLLTKDYPDSEKKWSILGQSFGGFCALYYLSFHPEGLHEAFVAGGMAPKVRQPDAYYTKLLYKVLEINQAYYSKFPEDIHRMHRLIEFVSFFKVKTRIGGVLNQYRIQNLGMFLISPNGWSILHDLLLRTDNDLMLYNRLTAQTITTIEQSSPYDQAILYAIIHEPIYLSGTASNWSFERALAANPAFNIQATPANKPIMLTVEAVTHETFTTHAGLKDILPAAEILAAYDQWPDLYDEEQLAKNTVPVYAAIYYDDVAVDFDFSVQRAKSVGNCKMYITNQFWHGGLRDNHEEVLGALFALRDDVIA